MQLNHCDGVLSNHLKYLIRATNISSYSSLYWPGRLEPSLNFAETHIFFGSVGSTMIESPLDIQPKPTPI